MRGSNQQLVGMLHECHDMCLGTYANYCVKEGKPATPEHSRIMLACIDICNVTADFVLRSAPLADELCRLCAKICELCADSCHALDDPQLRATAEHCRKAANSCYDFCESETAVA